MVNSPTLELCLESEVTLSFSLMKRRQLFQFAVSSALVAGADLMRSRHHAIAAPPQPPNPVAQALDRGDVAEAIRQIELRWKKQYEDYFQGKFTTQVLSAPEIASTLRQINRRTGRKSALFYAIPTAKHLDLMLLTANGNPIHRRITAANQIELTKMIQAFRMGVVRDDSDTSDYLEPGQQLYQWMITPLEPQLQQEGVNLLIFCLGPRLRSVPMAALHDGRRFLIEKYNLSIIPAFNLLDRQAKTSPETEILAMGASVFNNQPPLPGVPIELSAITQPPWQGTSLLNQQFTLKNLKTQRSKVPYGIVHLATHAEFASGDVAQSYIQFWDQRLRLDQIQELGLRNPPVQLLVLSACRTALGDTNAELGFAGLAVKAGSKAAIASLWSVSDASTILLMKAFYRQLKTATIKADALRAAQIDMIRNPDRIRAQLNDRSLPAEVAALAQGNLTHPYHWAAFTLIGNPW